MKTCDTCQHVCRNDAPRNPRAWLCDVFPWDEIDQLMGTEQPPYRYCRDVLRLSCPNNATPCVLWEALPETGELVVNETKGGKSVTFKQKETAE